MGVRDYDEGTKLLNAVAENLELNQTPGGARPIGLHRWCEPILERSELLDVCNRLRPRE